MAQTLLLFFLLYVTVKLYCLPATIGGLRDHHQRWAIAVLNIFLGWTLIGWVGALVWSTTAVRRELT